MGEIRKEIQKRVDFFASKSISPRTKTAYESDWHQFHLWCAEIGHESLPASPATVGAYLAELADNGVSVSTIVRRQTSISQIHQAAGHESPTKTEIISRVVKGIKRQYGRPAEHARALSWSDLQKMVLLTDCTYIGLRDASLLSLGWSGALRRSEIVGLTVGDVSISDAGAIISIRRSKTDQTGEGKKLGIPRARGEVCPVDRLQRWLDRRTDLNPQLPLYISIGARGVGSWFWPSTTSLNPRTVCRIVKRYGKIIGIDDLSAHSLRRGLATEAGARGVPERIIARHTRHRSTAVLRGYIDEGNIFTENPLLSIYPPAGRTSSDEL